MNFNVGDRLVLVNKEDPTIVIKGVVSHTQRHALSNLHLVLPGQDTSNVFSPTGWDITLDQPPLPTKSGSVIKVTKWAGLEAAYIALRTNYGWRFHTDESVRYTDAELQARANRGSVAYEVIYTP